MYAAQLTFKNIKAIPVKFEYKEIMDSENVHFKIILKGSDEQRAQIQVTPNGIQIENNSADGHYGMLVANGGEQIYEYEIHRNYAKKNNSYRKRRREE